jgi:TonB-dependent SusC/RagA subfamily outer membrane receptor
LRSPLPAGSVFLALALPAFAGGQQVGSVSGRVTDATTGYPLPGAQVFIQGGNMGALADAEGRYRLLSVPAGSLELSTLMLGYSSFTRAIDLAPDQDLEVDFALQPTAIALDEIVVTATGERRKRELGNAVIDIKAGNLTETAPVTSTFDLLQGRAPGVQVLSTGGGAGIGSRIRIRGSNSLSLSNEPIVYLDGIRIESGAEAVIPTGGQDLGRLNDLNPEEIESIEVVKGPSASTLYGTEAANGVIRITTKRGTPGPPRWSLYAEGGAVRDPYTYPDNYRAFDSAGNLCPLMYQLAGRCQVETVSHYQPLEDDRFSFMGTGWRQQYGLTVSGGADRVNYFLSGEWEEEVGPYELKPLYRDHLDSLGIKVNETTRRPQQLHKLSLRANVSVNVTDNAVFSVNTGWVGSTTALTFNDNTQYAAVRLGYLGGAVRPESETYDASIWYAGRTPDMLFAEDFFQEVGRFTMAARLNWAPLRWLHVRAVAGMDQVQRDETDYLPPGVWPDDPVYNGGYRWVANARIVQQTLDLGATGDLQLFPTLLSQTSLGFQFLRKLNHWYDSWGYPIIPGAETLSALLDHYAREDRGESRTLGVFVEEQLSWEDRLFLTGAVRLDDNSTFGRDFDAIVYRRGLVPEGRGSGPTSSPDGMGMVGAPTASERCRPLLRSWKGGHTRARGNCGSHQPEYPGKPRSQAGKIPGGRSRAGRGSPW